MSSEKKSSLKDYDLIRRGEKYSTPLGTIAFVGLRALDPILQYGILAHGVGSYLLPKIGLSSIPDGPPIQTGIDFIDNLGLSPYRLAILSMAIGSSIKHIFWLLYVSKEAFPLKSSLAVSAFNTTFNSTNALLAISTLSSSLTGSFPQARVIVGGLLYIAGSLVETISELQRKTFKEDPRNQGKLYTQGLFSITRHINYTGYSAWRAGYTMVASGWTGGLVALGYLVTDFNTRAIPALDEYCSKRYGEKWEEYKKKTPSKIIPGIW